MDFVLNLTDEVCALHEEDGKHSVASQVFVGEFFDGFDFDHGHLI